MCPIWVIHTHKTPLLELSSKFGLPPFEGSPETACVRLFAKQRLLSYVDHFTNQPRTYATDQYTGE